MLKILWGFSMPHSAFKHWPLAFVLFWFSFTGSGGWYGPPLPENSISILSKLPVYPWWCSLPMKQVNWFFYSIISSPTSGLTDGFFSLLLFLPVKHGPTRHHSCHVYNSIKFQSVIYTQFYFFFHTHTPTTYVQRPTVFIFHKLHQDSVKSSLGVSCVFLTVHASFPGLRT